MRWLGLATGTFAAIASAPAQPAMTEPGPGRAAAARSAGYVAVGVEGSVDLFFNGAVLAEAGVRIAASPFSLHALVGQGSFQGGGWSGPVGAGRYQEYRVGVEADRCSARSRLCGFLGVDAGYVSQRSTNRMEASRTAELAIARAGIDTGLDRVRLRVAFDLRTGSDETTGTTMTEPGGAGVTATLAYKF